MATNRKAKPKPKPASGTLSFVSRASLLQAQGPPAVPVLLPVAGQMVLIRRVHLPTLARGGSVPKPITAAIRKLTEYGVSKAQDYVEPDTYLETCAALARASVIVTPDSMQAAIEEANAILEEAEQSAEEIDETRQLAALQAALAEMPGDGEDGELVRRLQRQARRRLTDNDRLQYVREVRDRAFRVIEDAARDLDPAALRSLFVAVDQTPEDDQVILVDDINDTGDADPALCVSLHRNDLNELTRAIYVNGPGAFARFRV